MDQTERHVPEVARGRVEFSGFDADHLSEMLAQRYMRITIEPIETRSRVSMAGTTITLPGIKLNRSNFTHGMKALTEDPYAGTFFFFPLDQQVHSRESRGRFSAAPGSATALDGSTGRLLTCDAGLDVCEMTVERHFFAERLTVLLGRPFASDILFDPVLDARSGPYAGILSFARLVTSAEFGEAIDQSPFTAARMPATIADFLLENWRHSYSHILHREPPMVAPKHVKLALDLIADHPHMMPSAEETAKLCGVSLRALQYGFRRYVGASISEYQRRARLERARADLLATTDSIEVVAHRWAFSNAGRFSRHFKEQYGIFPSQIVRD